MPTVAASGFHVQATTKHAVQNQVAEFTRHAS